MPVVPLASLKRLAWNGIPEELRPIVWQILLGYLPCEASSRADVLASKRKEYQKEVKEAFQSEGGLDQAVWHQIRIDVPRTNPHLSLYSFEATQKALERILYVWAIQHPDSGYVQGINDLVTPFFQVFLSALIPKRSIREPFQRKFLNPWKRIRSGVCLHCSTVFRTTISSRNREFREWWPL